MHRTESALPTANNADGGAVVGASEKRGRGLINKTGRGNLKLTSKSSTVATRSVGRESRTMVAANLEQVLGIGDAIGDVKGRQLNQNGLAGHISTGTVAGNEAEVGRATKRD